MNGMKRTLAALAILAAALTITTVGADVEAQTPTDLKCDYNAAIVAGCVRQIVWVDQIPAELAGSTYFGFGGFAECAHLSATQTLCALLAVPATPTPAPTVTPTPAPTAVVVVAPPEVSFTG